MHGADLIGFIQDNTKPVLVDQGRRLARQLPVSVLGSNAVVSGDHDTKNGFCCKNERESVASYGVQGVPLRSMRVNVSSP